MKKLLSILLVSIMLLTPLALSVSGEQVIQETDTLVEVETLREENVKHFLNPDGTYTAIMYNNAVHRKDSEGNWQDIDNTMTENNVKNKQAYITSDERAIFSKKINSTENEIYTLNENGYKMTVSFSSNALKNTTAKLSNHAKKYAPTSSDSIETQYKKLKEIDTNTTILYKNALTGIDFEYVLSVNDIKENIIVRKTQEEYSYTFIYSLEGLIARLCDDGSVLLLDKNTEKEQYVLPTPYMYDATGELSRNVEYSLSQLENGDYELTVTADKDWVNSSERSLPVTIDPTVTTISGYYHYDTYVDSNFSNTTHGNDTVLYVSSTQTTFMRPASLYSLPDRATVSQVLLNVYYYYPSYTIYNTVVGVYPVTKEWNEQTLTWYTANNNYNMGIDFSAIADGVGFSASSGYTASSPGTATFNITELYKSAYTGKPFYGVALRPYSGGGTVAVLSFENLTSRAYYELTYAVDAPIGSGEYFVGNVASDGKFMRVRTGNIIDVTPLNGEVLQKWTFEYLHNGYYRITNPHYELALCMPSSNTGISGTAPTLASYSPIGRMQWKIVDAGNGTFNILPRTTETRMALSTDNSDFLVQQLEFQNNNNKDEWRFLKTGTDVYLLGVHSQSHDHYTSLGKIMNEILMTEHDGFNFVATSHTTAENVLSNMANAEIFVSRSHGANYYDHGNAIVLGGENSILSADNIYNFSTNTPLVDLSDCELALFIACTTANDDIRTLPKAAVNAGASVAIGFEQGIDCNTANLWTEKFFEYYSQGYTVEECCEYAVEQCIENLGSANGLDSYVIERNLLEE